jgi:Tfp pilus assembly protein PilX
MTLKYRIREEGGSALVAAVMIVLITLGLGMAVLSTADVQSHQTGNEVSGEAAFNLAEGALDAESDLLKQTWPSSATSACNQSSTPTSLCPGTSVTNSFSSTYAGNRFSNPQWSVQIVDDGSPESANYYTDSGAAGVPRYDANGDNRVWIRAQATLGGQTRIVVAEMVRQTVVVDLPHNMITAGGTYTSNDGNKIIDESKDPNTGASGTIAVRCTPPSGGPTYGNGCTGWDPGKGHLDPAGNYQGNYVDPLGGSSTLSPDTLNRLKQTAQAENTYYNGVCPSSLNGLVYVENLPPGTTCKVTGGQWNGPYTSSCPSIWPSPCPASNAAPGAIIFANGALEFNGNADYYGVVYMANAQGLPAPGGGCTSAQYSAESEPVFAVHGGANFFGSVFVDGCGQVDAGDSKSNYNYASTAFSGLSTFETAMLAKNTFRILPNS